MRSVNWFGLVGGTIIVVLILASIVAAVPWWQLQVGQGFVQANASPLNTNLSFFGTTLTIPILWVLNLTCLLSLAASAAAILVYSVIPTKSYSKHLLGFAYKKPFMTLLLFIITLLIMTRGIGLFLQLNIPIAGSTTVTLPASLTGGIGVSAPITTGFTWTFMLAIVGAATCIAARIYHRRIVTTYARDTAHQPTKT